MHCNAILPWLLKNNLGLAQLELKMNAFSAFVNSVSKLSFKDSSFHQTQKKQTFYSLRHLHFCTMVFFPSLLSPILLAIKLFKKLQNL